MSPTKLEHSIADAEAVVDSLLGEKDERLQEMQSESSTPIQKAFASERIRVLDVLIADARGDLEAAKRLQFSLAFSVTPKQLAHHRRQLKVALRRSELERKRA